MTKNKTLKKNIKNTEPFTIKNIDIISTFLKSKNIEYVFVQQPINANLIKKKYDSKLIEKYKELNLSIKRLQKEESNKFLYINHINLFDNNINYMVDSVHLGTIGNKIAADDIIKKIPHLLKKYKK